MAVRQQNYMDWSWFLKIERVNVVQAESYEHVRNEKHTKFSIVYVFIIVIFVAQIAYVCNWAKDNKYIVRPCGHQHNWSTIGPTKSGVILLNTMQLTGTKSINTDGQKPTATFSAGVTVDAATAFLQAQDNGLGDAVAPGINFEEILCASLWSVFVVCRVDVMCMCICAPCM